jgi:hypothetical protein
MATPAWGLKGNALGTNGANDFLGTTDEQPLVIKTGGVERVQVDASGNVGIGTTNPPSPLSVLAPTNVAPSLTYRGGGAVSIDQGKAELAIGTGASTPWPIWLQARQSSNEGWPLVLNPLGGNVGIGTTEPQQQLSVNGAESSVNGFGAGIGISNTAPGGRNWHLRAGASGTATPAGGLSIADDADYRLVIDNSGNVGIGTVSPSHRLEVAGDIAVTGDVLLIGADCAEEFDVAASEPPGPGTVMVIDDDGALRESRSAYDKKVAGVISGAGEYKHGLLLDSRPVKDGRVPVALIGKVYCKVDAQYAPIEVGDLLTTSLTEGHAMKAADALKAFGCVIGKALQALETGKGLIPILVALQ